MLSNTVRAGVSLLRKSVWGEYGNGFSIEEWTIRNAGMTSLGQERSHKDHDHQDLPASECQ